MTQLTRFLGLLALGLTLVPAILFATGHLGEGPMKVAMMVGVVLWFAAAPLWLKSAE